MISNIELHDDFLSSYQNSSYKRIFNGGTDNDFVWFFCNNLNGVKGKGNFYFNGVILNTLNLNKVNLRVLLDRTTIEVFADDGFSVLSKYAISDLKDNQISACSDDELLFDRFEVHKLKSIWR